MITALVLLAVAGYIARRAGEQPELQNLEVPPAHRTPPRYPVAREEWHRRWRAFIARPTSIEAQELGMRGPIRMPVPGDGIPQRR